MVSFTEDWIRPEGRGFSLTLYTFGPYLSPLDPSFETGEDSHTETGLVT